MAIRSFRDRLTEAVYGGRCPKGFPAAIFPVARRKLLAVEFAVEVGDLASPPGNRLELLAGDRQGQHSIRVNDQWRICFKWTEAGAEAVEIVDYHR